MKKVGNLDAALAQGKNAYFLITNEKANMTDTNPLPTIPKDYYCQWQVSLNSLHVYYLKIRRQDPPLEHVEIQVVGAFRIKNILDEELQQKGTDPDGWESYYIQSATSIVIRTKSLALQSGPTFQISLEAKIEITGVDVKLLKHIGIVLITILAIFIGTAIILLVIRCQRQPR